MKKFILRFIACVPFITMAHGFFAQEYRPLVDSNKVWYVYERGFPPEIETSIWKFKGDSIRENKKYMKVYHTKDSLLLNWHLMGIIREDSARKVFFKYLTHTEEELYYDFGAEVGDTLSFLMDDDYPEYPLIIKSIDTILLIDNFHRRYHLGDPYTDIITDTWIEGIGSLMGVLESRRIFYYGLLTILTCYYENDELVYSNPDFPLCYYQLTGIAKDSDEEPDILIVPNPVISCSRFQITNTPKTDFTLEIYDIMGKLLYTGRMDSSNSAIICRSDLSSGIFIYRVKHNQLIVRTGKIIIV